MDRYDTDLWKFLKGKDEKSLDLAERLKLATKFWQKVEKIWSKDIIHQDLKPSNVLINLTATGRWNGEMEITDFGIAEINFDGGKKAGTSGWAKGEQFRTGFSMKLFFRKNTKFPPLDPKHKNATTNLTFTNFRNDKRLLFHQFSNPESEIWSMTIILLFV